MHLKSSRPTTAHSVDSLKAKKKKKFFVNLIKFTENDFMVMSGREEDVGEQKCE